MYYYCCECHIHVTPTKNPAIELSPTMEEPPEQKADRKVFELDARSVSSTPSQLSLATTSTSARDRVVSSYAPGGQQNYIFRRPQEGPYRLTQIPESGMPEAYDRGKMIVFEGLDRSGKSTQCALLVERLREKGERIEHLRFPNRNSVTGQVINAYLAGDQHMDDHAVHLLFSANRWEMASEIERMIYDGITVVVDRYYYSGCVYSAAKEIQGLGLEWARHPDVGLPRPDLCIFLDVSPETVAARGGFGQEIYERREMQARVRELFEVMMRHPDEENDVVIVNADRGIDEVERTIQKWVKLACDRVDKQDLPLEHVRPW